VPTPPVHSRTARIVALTLAVLLGGAVAEGRGQNRRGSVITLDTKETLQQCDVVLEGLEDNLEQAWILEDSGYRPGSGNQAARVDEITQRQRLYDLYDAQHVTTMPDIRTRSTIADVFGMSHRSAGAGRPVSSTWALTGNTLLGLIVLIILCVFQRRMAPPARKDS